MAALKVRISNSPGWTIRQTTPTSRTGARRRAAAAPPSADLFVKKLEDTGAVEAVHTGEVSQSLPKAARRGAPAEPAAGNVALEVETDADELHVLMVRHPSQAITFHVGSAAPASPRRRGAAAGGKITVRFLIPVSTEVPEGQAVRRGPLSSILRTTILKIVGKLADLAMPALAGLWERKIAWKNRKEGWKLVTPGGLQGTLPELTDFSKLSKNQPNLLFIHGTFSHAAGAYKELATTRGSDGRTLFDSLTDIYGDRIFAFDHFTLCKDPRQNAQELLDALPVGNFTFDVVTHSRGGLVLRHLAELKPDFGPAASKVKLRKAILVAAPNHGTPLATPSRFDHFVTWITNVLDMFPDNPFTDGVSFVAEAIGWLAHRVGGAVPGLAAMDADGTEIRALSNTRDGGEYSALVSNYQATDKVLKRIADTGLTAFFGSANDLVVPSDGGWKTGSGIPGTRIGCFGNGGNLPQPPDAVTHVSFFSRPATVDFLRNTLRGEPLGLTQMDPTAALPHLLRRTARLAAAPPAIALPPIAPAPVALPIAPAALEVTSRAMATGAYVRAAVDNEVFHLAVIDVQQVETGKKSPRPPEWAVLIATFRNARVVEKMLLRNDPVAGRRFRSIIDIERAIQGYIDGDPNQPELPAGPSLKALGCNLFETLFQGGIRRLYDVARAEQINKRVNLIFTSHVSWLADLPLEFIYDPTRETFLATSEVNFIRNVVTAVPADLLPLQNRALRILVVVAQPLGLAHLSVEEEKQVILSGFRLLIEAGLVTVDVLSGASPTLLHRYLEINECDILHFVGHGEYDRDNDIGYLIFENESDGKQRVDSEVLQQIISRRQIRLVFLNACESGTGGRADFNKGVAPALVQAGVPAVIGNQYSVLDVSATAFARHLYWSLAQGQSIGDATREARVAVNYLITGEAIDWAVPVLFARDPSERLCKPVPQPTTLLEHVAEEQRTASRRGIGPKRDRIALWDVQRVIPHLDQIAARLTEVQDKFEFEAVSIPAPLGTWRRETKGTGAYLRPRNVLDRIREKPAELGVKRLIAFTNLPMAEGRETDLYAWDEDPEQRISLFSTYNFIEQLDPPYLSIERMVANAAASFLAAIPTGSHDAGPKDCPMFYNPDREVPSVAGPLKFCARDQRRIPPEIRKAVSALLEAF